MHATAALTYADFMQAKLLRDSFCRMFCFFFNNGGKYTCGAEAAAGSLAYHINRS